MFNSPHQRTALLYFRYAIPLILLCGSSRLFASNIHVRATDDTNHALPQVQVQILSQGKVVRTAVSSSEGQAEFAELPNGVYDIVASKNGFETATQTHV